VHHGQNGVDNVFEQPLLMLLVHRQQPLDPTDKLSTVTQEEK
jgi:hypothetical protein